MKKKELGCSNPRWSMLNVDGTGFGTRNSENLRMLDPQIPDALWLKPKAGGPMDQTAPMS